MSEQIRFAHLADLHLGAWRERRLTELNFKTFKKAIDKVIDEKVDFCLFAGDIFNNAMPPIELVNEVVVELMKLKENGIPLYVIGGSHDYSNSGKSFLSLLESAGVFIDVCKFEFLDKDKVNLKFTKDTNTNTTLSGILGRKKGLDKNYYMNLNESNLSKENFNLFMFHCTLNDLKPDFMNAVKVDIDSSFLPKGFDYYAGGHVHTHIEGKYSTGIISYPGPLFPNNFSELKREVPSFNLCTFDFKTRNVKIERQYIKTYEKEYVKVDFNGENPLDARKKIERSLDNLDLKNKILLLELSGVVEGRVSDIGINNLISEIYEEEVFHVLKNTYKLTSSKLEKIEIDVDSDSSSIEDEIITKFLENDSNKENYSKLLKNLLKLDLQKQEGEKNAQFEQRVVEAVDKSLN